MKNKGNQLYVRIFLAFDTSRGVVGGQRTPLFQRLVHGTEELLSVSPILSSINKSMSMGLHWSLFVDIIQNIISKMNTILSDEVVLMIL